MRDIESVNRQRFSYKLVAHRCGWWWRDGEDEIEEEVERRGIRSINRRLVQPSNMCLDWPKEVGEREKGIPGPRTRETRGRIHDKLLALEWSLVKQPSGTFLSRGSIPWDPTTTRLS